MNEIISKILSRLFSFSIPNIFDIYKKYRNKKKIKSILERRTVKKPNLPK